jgi:hypothetical protein
MVRTISPLTEVLCGDALSDFSTKWKLAAGDRKYSLSVYEKETIFEEKNCH